MDARRDFRGDDAEGLSFSALEHLVTGACLSAIGVRVSLATQTATKSMTLAVGLWLVLLALLSVIALVLIFFVFAAVQMFWWSFHRFSPPPGFVGPFVPLPISFGDGWRATMLFLYLVVAVCVVIESRYRFDRIAGRMTGGAVEVAVDQFLHGVPMAPIPIDGASAPAKTPSADLTGNAIRS